MTAFLHVPHPHVADRQDAGPVKVADQHPTGSGISRLNKRLGVAITKGVGTMWCAYLFTAVAFTSLPSTLAMHSVAADVSWTAQTFLQLVLLSIIMVGQDVQAKASDARAEQTFLDAEAVLHEAAQIQEHLKTQDATLTQLIEHMTGRAATSADISALTDLVSSLHTRLDGFGRALSGPALVNTIGAELQRQAVRSPKNPAV